MALCLPKEPHRARSFPYRDTRCVLDLSHIQSLSAAQRAFTDTC